MPSSKVRTSRCRRQFGAVDARRLGRTCHLQLQERELSEIEAKKGRVDSAEGLALREQIFSIN